MLLQEERQNQLFFNYGDRRPGENLQGTTSQIHSKYAGFQTSHMEVKSRKLCQTTQKVIVERKKTLCRRCP